MNVSLVSHRPMPNGKWAFELSTGQTMILRETWDEVLLNQPIETVGKWFMARYGWSLPFLLPICGWTIDTTKDTRA